MQAAFARRRAVRCIGGPKSSQVSHQSSSRCHVTAAKAVHCSVPCLSEKFVAPTPKR